MTVDGADWPAVLAGEVGNAFPCVGAGIHEDGKTGPFIVGVFLDDFFDVVESANGGGGCFGIGMDFHRDFASGPHLIDQFVG